MHHLTAVTVKQETDKRCRQQKWLWCISKQPKRDLTETKFIAKIV